MSDIYDLKALKAPTTTGLSLRMSARILEGEFPGNTLAAKLLRDVGMDTFRQASCSEALAPIHPLFESAGHYAQEVESEPPSLTALPKGSGSTQFESAADFVGAYRRGEITPIAVAERLIETIDRLENDSPSLGCVIEQRAEDLRKQAEASTRRYENGEALGPLDGVPVGVKDELDLAGYKTRVGTSFMGTEPAREDAFAVSRLRSGGEAAGSRASATQ